MSIFEYVPRPEDRETARELAGQIALGTWVLFGGAGVSVNSGLPSASQLIERIETELGLEACKLSRDDFARACSRYQLTRTRVELIEFLRRALDTRGCEPSKVHVKLLDLRPSEIVTTNVEDMWEKSLRQAGLKHCVIIQAGDWSSWTPDQTSLIKLHGDFSRPDCLVLAEDDYSRSLKDQVIQSGFLERLARFSFFFVGYAGTDEDLNREIVRASDLLGTQSRSHFLVTADLEDWARKGLATKNIKVIALGSYAHLEQFLGDLLAEAARQTPSRRAATTGLSIITLPLDQEVLVELFQSRYEPIRTAIAQWRLSDAESALKTLLGEVEKISGVRQDISAELQNFRQRLTLALATVLHWRGDRAGALELWRAVQARGLLDRGRRLQAALLLANLVATEDLATLIRESDDLLPERDKFAAALAWQQGNLEEALRLIPSETEDVDMMILRCRIEVARLSEDDVPVVERHLDRAWALAQGSVPARLEVANLTDKLLRRVVRDGWEVPGLDRGKLLGTIRDRYNASVEAYDALGASFPEGLVSALATVMDFHRYLDEEEKVAYYGRRLQALQRVVTRERVVAAYIVGDATIDVATLDSLEGQGLISRMERSLLESRFLVGTGKADQALEVLRDALTLVATEMEREAIFDSLLELLLETGRFEEAEALLQREQPQSPEFRTLMQGMFLLRTKGRVAAVEHLRQAATDFPRSRIILQNLINLLFDEARGQRPQ